MHRQRGPRASTALLPALLCLVLATVAGCQSDGGAHKLGYDLPRGGESEDAGQPEIPQLLTLGCGNQFDANADGLPDWTSVHVRFNRADHLVPVKGLLTVRAYDALLQADALMPNHMVYEQRVFLSQKNYDEDYLLHIAYEDVSAFPESSPSFGVVSASFAQDDGLVLNASTEPSDHSCILRSSAARSD
jgi:hypothetical protein